MLLRSVVDILSKNINRRLMDSSRVKVTHQPARIQSYKSGPFNFSQDISSESISLWSAQHDCPIVFDENGHDWKQGDDSLDKEVWEFDLTQRIIITAEYLPGKLNMRVNWTSRKFQDSSEWLLFPKVFQMLSWSWGIPDIDIFASKVHHQLHTCMA